MGQHLSQLPTFFSLLHRKKVIQPMPPALTCYWYTNIYFLWFGQGSPMWVLLGSVGQKLHWCCLLTLMGIIGAPHPEKQWGLKASKCELCGLRIHTQIDCLRRGWHLSWWHLMQKHATKILLIIVTPRALERPVSCMSSDSKQYWTGVDMGVRQEEWYKA